mmetsp:Transcript_35340/g.46656  ORF Transcript_35340/g.46656 Transcript_35340/m.46656 type:complete len:106 (-) Transcript_35340:660-977(-)
MQQFSRVQYIRRVNQECKSENRYQDPDKEYQERKQYVDTKEKSKKVTQPISFLCEQGNHDIVIIRSTPRPSQTIEGNEQKEAGKLFHHLFQHIQTIGGVVIPAYS